MRVRGKRDCKKIRSDVVHLSYSQLPRFHIVMEASLDRYDFFIFLSIKRRNAFDITAALVWFKSL